MSKFDKRPPAKKSTFNPWEMKAQAAHNKVKQINISYPWPVIDVPRYKVGRYGRWEVRETKAHVAQGYYLPRENNGPGFALYRMARGRFPKNPWMSFTAMEQQSHMPHVYSAQGYCLVVGLGMGMYLYNIIQKQEVERVVVIEKDPQIIELFKIVAEPEKWPCWDKVEIICRDAFEYEPPRSVLHPDHMYIDIWPDMFNDKAYLQSAELYDLYQPEAIGWWTMEGDFASWAFKKLHDAGVKFDRATLDKMYPDWANYTQMPVVCQDVERMGSLSAAALSSSCSVAMAKTDPRQAGQLQLRTLHLLGAYEGTMHV